MALESRLAQFAALSQKDKLGAYQALLAEILARESQPSVAADVHALINNAVNQDAVGLVIGRQVLTDLVKALSSNVVTDAELKKRIVQETLETVQPRIVSYEEQVNDLRFQLAEILEAEEEWSEAARVLMGISLDGQRSLPDEQKFRVYLRIVRLLLEDENAVTAEQYYNRAALLVQATADRELILQLKLCQARISDYNRKFLEAASRYHELSWVPEIDEEERKAALSAAVTCAVLAPAGPNRSRVLAALMRDERTAELDSFNILSKMFHDRILRSAEVKEFEGRLRPHQLATIAISSNDRLASAAADDDEDAPGSEEPVSTRKGPSTVLDRAVMEHNLLASSKVYNNITFRGLGALLDLTPGAAETMARKMIEQGRLKGSIDQVERLISFNVGGDEDDAQGKAGGLGDVEVVEEDTGAPLTKRWDLQIRMTAANVETIVQHLTEKGLVTIGPVGA